MLIIGLRPNVGQGCDESCPYYEPEGVIRQYGGPRKSHCKLSMEAYWFDCGKWNPRSVEVLVKTEEEWEQMNAAIGREVELRKRKLYKKNRKPAFVPIKK